jgi:glucokinase
MSVLTRMRVDARPANRQSMNHSLSPATGRPFACDTFRPVLADDATVLAVTIDPSRLSAGIVSVDGEILVHDRISTPVHEIWRVLEQLIGRVLAAAPTDRPEPSAVGVSCSGPIDVIAGSVSPHLIGTWTAFPLRDQLESLTSLPVVLDTTAGALAQAERRIGEAVDVDTFLMVIADTTIESAGMIGGDRLRGALGNAGSLGHIVVDPGGRKCWCGASGCLAALASSTELEREMNRPLRRATETIIERTGIMYGRALASMLALVDVSTVFITGSVVDTFGDPFLATIEREVRLRSRLAHLREFSLVELSGTTQPLVAAASVASATRR